MKKVRRAPFKRASQILADCNGPDSRPLILTGCPLPWGARPLEELVRKVGKRRVVVEQARARGTEKFTYAGKTAASRVKNSRSRKFTFKEFAETLSKKSDLTHYLQSTRVDLHLPELSKDAELSLIPEVPPRIWIGSGQRVTTHFDQSHNFALLVHGRKRFVLYPPDQLPNLYPGPLHSTPFGAVVSLVDPWKPDFRKFPKYRAALKTALVADLKPGEMLFLPAYWWHNVESWDLNILLNYWWPPDPRYYLLDDLTIWAGLMTVRHYPPHLKSVWRVFFEHYVMSENPNSHLSPRAQGLMGAPSKVKMDRIRRQMLSHLKKR